MAQLMQAVKANDDELVRSLIASGVDVDETDARGDVPLIIAAYQGHTDIVRRLLEAGADVTAVDPGMKATALHAAAFAGRTGSAKLLIEYGIDIDKQGPYNGYTALHDAVWQNNVETAAVIIEAGANLDVPSNEDKTALMLARDTGHTAIVELIENAETGE